MEGKLREPTGKRMTKHFVALCNDLFICTKYKKREVGFDCFVIDSNLKIFDIKQMHIDLYNMNSDDFSNRNSNFCLYFFFFFKFVKVRENTALVESSFCGCQSVMSFEVVMSILLNWTNRYTIRKSSC